MRDSPPLHEIRFGNADVEPPVEIPRVGVDNLTTKFLRQLNAESRLSYARRARDDDNSRTGFRQPVTARGGRGLVVASFHGTYYDDVEGAATGLAAHRGVIT